MSKIRDSQRSRRAAESAKPEKFHGNTDPWGTKKGGYCCDTENSFPTLNPEQEGRAMEMIRIQQEHFNNQQN